MWYIPEAISGAGADVRVAEARLVGDGVVEADAMLVGDVAGRYVALACHVDDAGGEYVFAIRPENQSYRLLQWEQEDITIIAGERLPELIRAAENVNQLRLDCRGSTITASVNGRKVATATADSGARGHWYVAAGIFAENTQPASINAYFDHITVSRATPTP